MALFGFGKDKKEAGAASEIVLAYLEEAQRNRTPFTLVGPRKTEVQATLVGIDEAAGSLAFQAAAAPVVDKGSRVELIFIQEGLRVGGSGGVADLRGTQVQVSLPETLDLKERRSQPRARLNPKEGATLTALTGLFEGVGITGVVENISEGGARVRVEKAMSIKGEKRLPLSTILVPPGQPFMLIKVNHAPKCPAVLELEGRAVFLEQSVGGLVMGIAFDPPKADVATALRGLVASRTSPVPAALPAKARRRPETALVEPGPAGGGPVELRHADPRPTVPKGPAPAPEGTRAAEALPAAAAPAPAPEAVPDRAETPDAAPAIRNDAVLRLRKRSRAVVALVPTPACADRMKEFLQEAGFGRVLVATDLHVLQEYLQQPNLAMVFLDGDLGALEALQLVNGLKSSLPALPPTILAVEEASTSLVLAARRHGVAQVLVKPYDLDAAFCDLLTQYF